MFMNLAVCVAGSVVTKWVQKMLVAVFLKSFVCCKLKRYFGVIKLNV
jgi:hypothetical protein